MIPAERIPEFHIQVLLYSSLTMVKGCSLKEQSSEHSFPHFQLI